MKAVYLGLPGVERPSVHFHEAASVREQHLLGGHRILQLVSIGASRVPCEKLRVLGRFPTDSRRTDDNLHPWVSTLAVKGPLRRRFALTAAGAILTCPSPRL